MDRKIVVSKRKMKEILSKELYLDGVSKLCVFEDNLTQDLRILLHTLEHVTICSRFNESEKIILRDRYVYLKREQKLKRVRSRVTTQKDITYSCLHSLLLSDNTNMI